MNRTSTAIALGAALTGFVAGYALKSAPASRTVICAFVPPLSRKKKNLRSCPSTTTLPASPRSRPNAPPTTYWSVDDLRKAHSDLAEVASKALKEAGKGSSQSFCGGRAYFHAQFQHFQLLSARLRTARAQPH